MDDLDPVKDLEKGFDVVVMGTGLTETILSGVMSVEGKRVLHIDSNSYYGGDGASLKMSQVYKKYRTHHVGPLPPGMDKDRDWNIDLIPKFLMANGELARILRNLKQVQDNVQFQQIGGSYVYRASGGGLFGTSLGGASGGINKVPSTAAEALTSSLIGVMEKGRLKKFLEHVAGYDGTSGPIYQGTNLDTVPMKTVYEQFKLEKATQEFVGHAMALYSDDSYLELPARQTFKKILLYAQSVAMYGKSPYIYPLYGLGELPSAFTRLSAVHGGTYMLNTEVLDFEYTDGKVSGVKIKFENPKQDNEFIDLVVKTPRVLASPDYVPDNKKKMTGQRVIRAICVLKHEIKEGVDSGQVIIPQSQADRKHDIYIAVLSSTHNVCPPGHWIAIVSTIAEKADNPQEELKLAFDLLHPFEERFMLAPSALWEPTNTVDDNIFVSKSLDATSHLETCTDDVKDLYKRMEGKDLDIDGLKQTTAED
jgi:Rab GDP dissociation inhibitor